MNNKPVAYYNEGTTLYFSNRNLTEADKSDPLLKPLYTKEQLQPKAQMTQAEFDEWKELYYRVVELSLTACKMLNEISDNAHNSIGKYTKLAKRVYQGNDFMSVSKKQAELVNLFINYNTNEPEETIEIVPNKKWFVRSKERDEKYGYWYLHKTEHFFFHEYIKEISTQFDTKEEAELWTNPLTEAVQLPVE